MPRSFSVIHDTVRDSALEEVDTIIGKVGSYAATVAEFRR